MASNTNTAKHTPKGGKYKIGWWRPVRKGMTAKTIQAWCKYIGNR